MIKLNPSHMRCNVRQAGMATSLLLGCVTALLAACQPPAPPAPIACGACEAQDRIIRLQPAYQDQGHGFTHPLLLSPEEWKVILQSIQVQGQKQGFLFFTTTNPVEPAFTHDEIEYLSPTLSRVFGQAPPDARVVFALSRHPSPDLTEITSGSWFVKEARLHLVLANYRYAVTMRTVRDVVWQDPMWTKAGPFYDFVPGEHQTVQPENAERPGLFTTTLPSLSIEYKQLLLAQSTASPAGQKGQTQHQVLPLPSQTRPSPASLEERLQTLKRGREEGLITDEEYRSKKQQLLDRL
jgi:hypothetical protein